MGRDLGLDGVVDHFTLNSDEAGWLRNKTGATRLGFAVQLKFLTWRGRFPRMRMELPPDAVEHVAKQVGVAASELGFYDFTSRAAKRHRSELRDLTGWHECSKTDLVKLVSHLVDVIWHDERREEQVRAELLRQMRADLIEPPTAAQVNTIIRSVLHQADERAAGLTPAPTPEERAAEVLAAREAKEAAENAATAEESNAIMKAWRTTRRAARAAIRRITGHSMRRGCIQAMLDAGDPPEAVAVHSRHSPRSTAFDAYRKKKLAWQENPTLALGLAA